MIDEHDYCLICGNYRICKAGICEYCFNNSTESGTFDYYDEPIFYECAMCGLEMIDYEVVRGHRYCRSCASIERYG